MLPLHALMHAAQRQQFLPTCKFTLDTNMKYSQRVRNLIGGKHEGMSHLAKPPVNKPRRHYVIIYAYKEIKTTSFLSRITQVSSISHNVVISPSISCVGRSVCISRCFPKNRGRCLRTYTRIELQKSVITRMTGQYGSCLPLIRHFVTRA